MAISVISDIRPTTGRVRMTTGSKRLVIAIVWSVVLATIEPASAAMITSTFNSNAEGWTSVTLDYPTPGAPPPILASYAPNWLSTGGTPGGFIYLTDPDGHLATGDTQYWRAPTAFHGNLSAYYGGSLSFDQTDYTAFNYGPFDQEDVILVGGGLTLVYDTVGYPSTGVTWTNYNVGLSSPGG
jgi:hypothetical protein